MNPDLPISQAIFDSLVPTSLGLPGKFTSWRPGQVETIDDIVASPEAIYLLDAPTGSGKSLVGAAAAKRFELIDRVMERMTDDEAPFRCIYLTQTIQLQNQVLRDFPYARMVKGRGNYLCDAFLGQQKEKMKHLAPDEFQRYLSSIELLKASDCPSKNCGYTCTYNMDKKLTAQAPLAVLNTKYYLTEVNGPRMFSGANLVVLDEVDSVEASLLDYIEFSVSQFQCKKYRLQPPNNKESLEEWLDWAEESRMSMLEYIDIMDKQLPLSTANWSDLDMKNNREKKAAESFLSKMAMFLAEVNDKWIIDIGEKPKAGWVVTFKPVTVAAYTEKYLWKHGSRFLGMSGTILDPEILADDLGIKSYSYRRMDSQFPVDNRLIHVNPVANLKYAKMHEELPKLLQEVANIVMANIGENILIHTVSYNIRNYLMEELPKCGVDPEILITHNSEDRADKLQIFKESRGLIMISPSFDRGVDLPGDECRVVIICKVPYLALGDKQTKARMAMPRGQQWYNLRAIQTVLQMTGRAVRSEKDFASTYVLDRQFKMLLARTRKDLPKWWLEAIR